MNANSNAGARTISIVLAVAGVLLFGQSLVQPFHFDDALFLNDANVANPAGWSHFLNPLHLRQLTYFTFYLNHLIAGTNPASYHFVNLVLHVANAVLFFVLLDGLGERPVATIAAALFLVHPIQTEPVMYVYQRSILLACFFSLLALLALQRNRNWLAVLLFICAFESKESAVAAILIGAMFLRVRPERRKDMRWAALVVGAVMLSIAAVSVLAYQHERTVGIGAIQTVAPETYLLTETHVVYTYLRLLVFPHPQSIEYDIPWVHTFDWSTAACMFGLLTILALGVLLTRIEKWRVTGFAVIAFFIVLAPTATVVPSTDAVFEHRLYLPMLAFSLFVASLIAKLEYPKAIAVPVLVLLSMMTLLRGNVWATDASLWQDAVLHAPNKARAWFNLGGAYMQSDAEQAQKAYQHAIELRPDFGEAYYDLGVLAQSEKNYHQALDYYQHAISLDASYWPAWNNLGNTLVSLGESERALHAFEMTLRLNPEHWPSQYNIAIVEFNSGRFTEAIPRLRTVLDWRPDFRDARYLLAVALFRAGKRAEAESEWRKIETTPGQPPMPTTIPTPAR